MYGGIGQFSQAAAGMGRYNPASVRGVRLRNAQNRWRAEPSLTYPTQPQVAGMGEYFAQNGLGAPPEFLCKMRDTKAHSLVFAGIGAALGFGVAHLAKQNKYAGAGLGAAAGLALDALYLGDETSGCAAPAPAA